MVCCACIFSKQDGESLFPQALCLSLGLPGSPSRRGSQGRGRARRTSKESQEEEQGRVKRCFWGKHFIC